MNWNEAHAVLRERRAWLDQIIQGRAGPGAALENLRRERDALDVVLREPEQRAEPSIKAGAR